MKVLGPWWQKAAITALFLATLGLVVSLRHSTEPLKPRQKSGARVVSLSPGITETISVLGAEKQLVGISNYCPQELSLPRIGSAISPNYESIVRLQPTLIVTTKVAGTQLDPLHKLAPTLSLPWLTSDEFIESVGVLSDRLDHASEGKALQKRLKEALFKKSPLNAPRIVWALDLGDSGGAPMWYVRDDSIHGAVLRAAGGKNAVTKTVLGEPQLSAEEFVSLSPDGVVVVVPMARAALAREHLEARIAKLSVASKKVQLVIVEHEQAMSVGPSVLSLIDKLRAALDSRFPTRTTQSGASP